ncbi:uncharacterized protein FIBRA_05081 [Fibroporia radiculosa]|uniref:Uncharacterized protein n=1 Tax=Fibroporia radiculosa TaxID=599839 RepID=J4IAI4_9APHY|nr:uncharacterized protein FIBRA_05081 [Fibroporia radiculosa]CCM02966.1 predicted protein [Fibroporia radiculosa]
MPREAVASPVAVASGRLPKAFTSLYRLFLRTLAASVLNKRSAAQRLRELWRPTFSGAAQVLHRLEDRGLDAHERKHLRHWYSAWEQRTDNTLSLLLVSAQSRGLPHRLTRNLNFLQKEHPRFRDIKAGSILERQWWNPQLPQDSERYKPRIIKLGSRADRREDRKDKWRKLDEDSWGALGEAVLMAEGRSAISLGRILRSP